MFYGRCCRQAPCCPNAVQVRFLLRGRCVWNGKVPAVVEEGGGIASDQKREGGWFQPELCEITVTPTKELFGKSSTWYFRFSIHQRIKEFFLPFPSNTIPWGADSASLPASWCLPATCRTPSALPVPLLPARCTWHLALWSFHTGLARRSARRAADPSFSKVCPCRGTRWQRLAASLRSKSYHRCPWKRLCDLCQEYSLVYS